MHMPETRGKLTENRSLSDLTWLRVGGPADWLFQPADIDDLAGFLAALDRDVSVFPMGVGSNLIVRDGGLRAIRLLPTPIGNTETSLSRAARKPERSSRSAGWNSQSAGPPTRSHVRSDNGRFAVSLPRVSGMSIMLSHLTSRSSQRPR